MAYMSPGLFPDVDATRLRHEMHVEKSGNINVTHFSRMVLPMVVFHVPFWLAFGLIASLGLRGRERERERERESAYPGNSNRYFIY